MSELNFSLSEGESFRSNLTEIDGLKVHHLKTVQPFWDDLALTYKKFEVRKNDRDFQQFDHLFLWEFVDSKFTGRVLIFNICYLLKDFVGIQEGYVVLGLADLCYSYSEILRIIKPKQAIDSSKSCTLK